MGLGQLQLILQGRGLAAFPSICPAGSPGLVLGPPVEVLPLVGEGEGEAGGFDGSARHRAGVAAFRDERGAGMALKAFGLEELKYGVPCENITHRNALTGSTQGPGFPRNPGA